MLPGTYSSHIPSRSTTAPEELRIDVGVVESRHGTAIQLVCPKSEHLKN
jgi:hypothetical protein